MDGIEGRIGLYKGIMGCCEFVGSDRIGIAGVHLRQDSGVLTLVRTKSEKSFGETNPMGTEPTTTKSTLKLLERNSEDFLDNSSSHLLALPEISNYSSIQSWKAIEY